MSVYQTGVAIRYEIQQRHGPDRLWKDERTNTKWFDRLMGRDGVRLMLRDGETPDVMAAGGECDRASFIEERCAALVYED